MCKSIEVGRECDRSVDVDRQSSRPSRAMQKSGRFCSPRSDQVFGLRSLQATLRPADIWSNPARPTLAAASVTPGRLGTRVMRELDFDGEGRHQETASVMAIGVPWSLIRSILEARIDVRASHSTQRYRRDDEKARGETAHHHVPVQIPTHASLHHAARTWIRRMCLSASAGLASRTVKTPLSQVASTASSGTKGSCTDREKDPKRRST